MKIMDGHVNNIIIHIIFMTPYLGCHGSICIHTYDITFSPILRPSLLTSENYMVQGGDNQATLNIACDERCWI